MAKYEIEITETLRRLVEIEAESREEAYEKVEDLYLSGDIVLDADDFVEYEAY